MADGWGGEALGGRGSRPPRLHHHQQCIEQGDREVYICCILIFLWRFSASLFVKGFRGGQIHPPKIGREEERQANFFALQL